jgi:hypothetical protein
MNGRNPSRMAVIRFARALDIFGFLSPCIEAAMAGRGDAAAFAGSRALVRFFGARGNGLGRVASSALSGALRGFQAPREQCTNRVRKGRIVKAIEGFDSGRHRRCDFHADHRANFRAATAALVGCLFGHGRIIAR